VPHTLLLADDSVTIQRVIELTFAEEDVQVVAVSDGDQAIQRLESAPPDIVLADIGMPGRNGYEVARYVRQSPRLSHIPVVLLTGAFEPVDQAKATEVGCDGVLAKPFEPQLVIGRVKELLSSPSRKSSFDAADAGMSQPPAADVASHSFNLESAADEVAPGAATNLDEYFDRLDNAFANMSSQPAPAGPAAHAVAPPPIAAPHHDAPAAPAAAAVDLPLSYASPEPPPLAAPVVPASTVPAPPIASHPVHAEVSVPAMRALPSVADAFAAILAAEQHDASSARPVWPATAAVEAPVAAAPAAPEIDDVVIDRIVERVLARISVGDRVTEVAERLVREEIERIKASIR
jgi:CheY-like chemotaxis protein